MTKHTEGADQIYASGPESLAAGALTIFAGPVSGYTTHILTTSKGDAPIPLTWIVSGRIDQPHTLKGAPAKSAIEFVRQERATVLQADPSVPEWQLEYDHLAPEDHVTLFLTGDPAQPLIAAIPSGRGPRDLAGLLSEILPILGIQDSAEQIGAWLYYLGIARSDEGRKAGLRALLRLNVSWTKFGPAIEFLIGSPNSPMRSYVFGLVTFAGRKGKFGLDAAAFLSRHFVKETDPRVSLGYVLNLKMLLAFTSSGALKATIADGLRYRASSGPLPPEIAEQYRQIHAAHPGLL